jgi:hypothetical protein
MRDPAGLPARRPGSHKWGVLTHETSDDPKSILAKGQYITDPFDESQAVDFVLQPGEMVMFNNMLVHGSGTNLGPDRRYLLLVEMLPTWASAPKVRQSAMLMRGVDTYGTFDDEPRPDAEWSPTAVANWTKVVNARAKLIFADGKVAPSEAYGGTARGDITSSSTGSSPASPSAPSSSPPHLNGSTGFRVGKGQDRRSGSRWPS